MPTRDELVARIAKAGKQRRTLQRDRLRVLLLAGDGIGGTDRISFTWTRRRDRETMASSDGFPWLLNTSQHRR